MADRDDGRRRTVRAVFGLAVAGALGVGAWGLTLYVRPAPGLDVLHRDLDLAYNDLQLFVLSSDPLNGGPYPWQLDVARFLAPLATVYALAEAVLAVLGERMARRSLRRRRGHTIVVGDSAAAHAIARGLARTAGADVVTAADGEPETLRAHGIVGAAAIYACETEETHRGVNVATVLTAAALRRHGGLQAYAQVADADLALTLRARRLGLPSGDKARLDFFNVEEVAAGLVIGGTDLATVATPHILISGLGTFGRAVLVEYARHWRLRSPWREYRPLVTVVAADAATGVREVTAQWPFVGDVCRIHPVTGQLGPALMASLNPAPTTAYLCDDDEVRAIRTALGAAALWRGGPRSLVVRLDVMSRLGSAFHGGDAGTRDALLLDDLDGRLLLAGVTEMASDTVIAVQQDLVERLAQALHEQYLLTQLAVGQRVATKPALTLWPELNDDLKASNRTQAGDIGTKLRKINCTVAPRGEDDNAFGFTDDEVALLAEHEHDRWFAERHDTGWRYAEHRDDDAMLHPAMLPWAELTAPERDKNSNAVHALPIVLADVGLRIVRLTSTRPSAVPSPRGAHPPTTVATMDIDDALVDEWAHTIHALYRTAHTRPQAGQPDTDLDLSAANRAQALDIPAKLRQIGAAIGPPGDEPFSFTDTEIEQLAEREHGRWRAERAAAGWTFGAVRDDDAKHHPSLIDWDVLSPDEREKDRDAVRNIPTILASSGHGIRRVRPVSPLA